MILKKLLFALSFLTFTAFSQNVTWEESNFPGKSDEFKEAKKEFLKGEKELFIGDGHYRNALRHFEKAYKFNPDNAELNYMMGRVILKGAHKENAHKYFDKAYELDSTVADDILFELALSHHLNEDWDVAIDYYKQFEAYILSEEHKDESPIFIEKINIYEKHIEECQNGKELSSKPVDVVLRPLPEGINTEYDEYSPVISADDSIMYFTTRRGEVTGSHAPTPKEIEKDKTEEVHYEDIMYSLRQPDGSWSEPLNIGSPINTDDHDATVSLSPDGEHMIFYRAKRGEGKLYDALVENDEWVNPVELPETINAKKAHNPSAVYTEDRKRIFFASTREEGNLGTYDSLHDLREYTHDIFYSDWDENSQTWGPAKNLGATVNTKYNERGLYLHPNGKTLFFSSEGHNSMGGYDIFYSDYDEASNSWSNPTNLGYPINGPEDDIYFVLTGDGRTAYYSTEHKDGIGMQDIYEIKFKDADRITFVEEEAIAEAEEAVEETTEEEAVVETQQANSISILGKVTDVKDSAPVKASLNIKDLTSGKTYNAASSSVTGKYSLQMPVNVKEIKIESNAEGYLFYREDYKLQKTSNNTYGFNIEMKKAEKGAHLTLNDIYFAVNDDKLQEESFETLDKVVDLLNDNPKLEIEIGGHTDNTGSESYNLKLSERRAKAVVDYLVEKKVDPSRLEFKGYGSSDPKSTNETEQGKKKNRRTELIILKI